MPASGLPIQRHRQHPQVPNASGNTIEIAAEFQPSAASVIEWNVPRSPGREEFTRIQFYRNRGFIDRQSRKQASALSIDSSYSSTLAAVRVYPGRPDSVGVSLRSQGLDTVLTSLDVWQMANVYH